MQVKCSVVICVQSTRGEILKILLLLGTREISFSVPAANRDVVISAVGSFTQSSDTGERCQVCTSSPTAVHSHTSALSLPAAADQEIQGQ